MTHRIVSAAVLALIVGGASPALAFSRIASFAWSPATGPVAGYAVYASIGGAAERLVATVAATSADIVVDSGVYFTVRVAAYDATGRVGPFSDPASELRLCPGDFDGDEVVGLADYFDARTCLGLPGTGFCAGADLDFDGVVGMNDLLASSVGSDACAGVLCLGDFDGDHAIGLADYAAALNCYGGSAAGACAPGDFDANGVISPFDLNTLGGLIGSNACTL